MIMLVLFLATRRLTSLIVDDTIFNKYREQIWKNHSPNESLIGYLLTCRRCSSIWAAGMTLLLTRYSSGKLILDILALSEATILLDESIETFRPKSLMN